MATIPEERLARYRDAWASFVWELRRHGFIGSPDDHKMYFLGYFDDYLAGRNDDLAWHESHCCDPMGDEDGLGEGRGWDEWTEDDRKKWDEEYKALKGASK